MTPRAASPASAPVRSGLRLLAHPLTAAVVLVLFYGALIWGMRQKSATFDETGHGAAGASYWKYNDYRLDPEGGQLPKRWIALPLWLGGFAFPQDSPGWDYASNFSAGDEYFNRRGNDPLLMLQFGRAASALITVALGVAVWLWARYLFGALAGLLSLVLYVLSPPVLANGALLKDDVASAFMLLAATTAFWAMLRRFTPLRVGLSAAATGLMFVTKFSAVVLVPVAGLLFIAWLVTANEPISVKVRRFVLILLTQAAAIWLVVWVMFGFRFEAFNEPKGPVGRFAVMWEWVYDRPHQTEFLRQLGLSPEQQAKADAVLDQRNARAEPWPAQTAEALEIIGREILTPEQRDRLATLRAAPPERIFPRLIYYGLKHHALPEAYLYGMVHVWRTSREKPAFLNGEFSATGWRSYTPYVFAIKTPWLFMILVAVAACIAVAYWRRLFDFLPLLALFVVYWIVAITGHINIGQRHLLPIYPPLFILAGILASPYAASWVVQPWLQRVRPWLLGGGIVVLAVEAAWWFPHHLSYFNGFVAPARAYRHIVDSSLDWGQDLPAVRDYLARTPPRGPAFLAYFGASLPATYGITARSFYGQLDTEAYLNPAAYYLPGWSLKTNEAELVQWQKERPTYDPTLIVDLNTASGPAVIFLKKPAELRLTGGTYFISATLMQPVSPAAFGPWNDKREAEYQSLSQLFAPLESDDNSVRLKAVQVLIDRQAFLLYGPYRMLRFERLASYLRAREPDEALHYSILVYHLTDADIETALHGPPPKL